MPLLIGDIGGTTSRWVLLHGAGEAPVKLPGFNPASGDPCAMQEGLRQMARENGTADGPLQVVAYGAGCGDAHRAERMRQVLLAVWPQAVVQVESDLLGAARGLYGQGRGLVLILGTGMNAGYYDGTSLGTPMPSLGYILGDEGSGADIGKHLLHDALYGLLPSPLDRMLFRDGLGLPAILETLHRGPSPQTYLASFTARLAAHLEEPYVRALVRSRFAPLAQVLARYFGPEQRQEARACGSVAFGFEELLQESLAPVGIRLRGVEADPLTGLVAHHLGQGR